MSLRKYYSQLDLPQGATAEEVKAQYKQLVRIYHPDRFRNENDKVYAQTKLQQINEAYNVLYSQLTEPGGSGGSRTPEPIVLPAHVNFGTVMVGDRARQQVQVGNAGGDVASVKVLYSEQDSWFTILDTRRIYEARPLPLMLDIEADTSGLTPSRQYDGEISIQMDDVTARVTLQLEVMKRSRSPLIYGLITAAVALIGILLVALLAGPMAERFPALTDITRLLPFPSNAPATATVAVDAAAGAQESATGNEPPLPTAAPQRERYLFSAFADGQPQLFSAALDGSDLRGLGAAGVAPMWAPDGTQITFLSADSGQVEVMAIDAGANTVIQLSTGNSPKISPVWSPEGSRVAYIDRGGESARLYIAEIAGGESTAVAEDIFGTLNAESWSPQGDQIAVTREQEGEPVAHVISLSTGENKALTNFSSWDAAWSPGGDKIAVASDRAIYTVNALGRDLVRLTFFSGWAPEWSQEGDRIAVLTTWSNENDVSDLWTIPIQAGEPVRVTTSETGIVAFKWLSTDLGFAYLIEKQDIFPPTYELWTVVPGADAQYVMDVSEPHISWLR